MKITTQDKKNVGLSFNPSKHLQYGIGLSLNDYSNLPLFNRINNTVQNLEAGLKYETIFENKAVTIELEGNLRYQFSDKVLFQNSFKYIQFSSLKSNDKPWGIAPIEFNSTLSWSPNKKWSIDGGMNYWSGATFINGNNLPYDMSNSLVLNAGFTYQFTRLWKVWAKGENLLDKPYQRWADYPSLGIQLIAGVVYSFHK
jgi:outer membrane receptor for ferrienterochelin and colicin